MAQITFSEITSFEDPLYDSWLDLYQSSFPTDEQMQISSFNRILRRKVVGHAQNDHLIACLDEEGVFAGMAYYEHARELGAAALWYFAVEPDRRGQGLGASIYASLRSQIRTEQPGVRALLYEVQDPAHCNSPEETTNAHRRIAFYKRCGAFQLTGIEYSQSVGWQPALSMLIMAHLYDTMSADEVAELAQQVFGELLTVVGTLALD